MEFGIFLTKLRKERGILQKDLANYLNVSVSTISNYEKDVHLPDLDTLVRIADYFDVSTDYLLQRTDCYLKMDTLNRPIAPEHEYTLGDLVNFASDISEQSAELLLSYCHLLVRHDTQPNCKEK